MQLIILTGMSGAGKTQALKKFEDSGYFCVDNLPSPLLSEFVELCEKAVPRIRRAAVTIDSRESLLSRQPHSILERLDALRVPYEILFLDARDDVLRKRYNESRRRHPLGDAGDAYTGVQRERAFLQGIRNRAAYVLDTSDIRPRDLPKTIAKVLPEYESRDATLLLCSFGYKRGVPVDADIVFDMRFIPNPFYVEQLRPLSGLDQTLRDYVFAQPFAREFMDRIEEMLLAMIPLYQEQDKRILRVCFGCTGGRHRSVAAAEEMAQRFHRHGLNVRVYHRDLVVEAADIAARFSIDG